MAAAAASVVAPPLGLEPWWADRRFQVPAAFVGATLLATATFATLYFVLRRGSDPGDGTRDDRGWKFPQLGYVLCPQGAGLSPPDKPIDVGSIVILGLGSPAGQSVEAAWGRVAGVDARDPNRIAVVLVGQASETGQVDLQTDRHGFRVSQRLWITRDCVWEVLRYLDDPNGRILCGAELAVYDGPDGNIEPDGYVSVAPPVPLGRALGRTVDLLMVSRGAQNVWALPVTAEVTAISPTNHVATVRVTAVGRDEAAERPGKAHHVRAGTTFDITWDCVLQYR